MQSRNGGIPEQRCSDAGALAGNTWQYIPGACWGEGRSSGTDAAEGHEAARGKAAALTASVVVYLQSSSEILFNSAAACRCHAQSSAGAAGTAHDLMFAATAPPACDPFSGPLRKDEAMTCLGARCGNANNRVWCCCPLDQSDAKMFCSDRSPDSNRRSPSTARMLLRLGFATNTGLRKVTLCNTLISAALTVVEALCVQAFK